MSRFIVGILMIIGGVIVLILRFVTNYSLKDERQPREKVDYFTMPVLGLFGIIYGLYLVITFI